MSPSRCPQSVTFQKDQGMQVSWPHMLSCPYLKSIVQTSSGMVRSPTYLNRQAMSSCLGTLHKVYKNRDCSTTVKKISTCFLRLIWKHPPWLGPNCLNTVTTATWTGQSLPTHNVPFHSSDCLGPTHSFLEKDVGLKNCKNNNKLPWRKPEAKQSHSIWWQKVHPTIGYSNRASAPFWGSQY